MSFKLKILKHVIVKCKSLKILLYRKGGSNSLNFGFKITNVLQTTICIQMCKWISPRNEE